MCSTNITLLTDIWLIRGDYYKLLDGLKSASVLSESSEDLNCACKSV